MRVDMQETHDSGMPESHLMALQAAVNLARDEQIQHVGALRGALRRRGFSESDIEGALKFWASRLHRS